MASEPTIEFRLVKTNYADGSVTRMQYRTRNVLTGVISLTSALTGLDAWSAWQDFAPTVVEEAPPY